MTEKSLRDTLQLRLDLVNFFFFTSKKFSKPKRFRFHTCKTSKNGVKNLRSLLKKLFVLMLPILFILSQNVSAMPEIMPLYQVKGGMNAVGYTVVDDSGQIKPFNVEIVGVLNGGKGGSSMIMARASGDVINMTGGVLQGMSGSPIYVDGKLIGALATSYKETSPYTFFIRPIEDMLAIWNLPDKRELDKVATLEQKKSEEELENDNEVEVKNEEVKDENLDAEVKEDDDVKVDESVDKNADENVDEDKDDAETLGEEKSAIFFSGFDINGSKFLQKELSPLGFEEFFAAPSVGANTVVKHNATLVPGAPMGVALVYGDFTVGSTGTVTAVDDKKILGFGHSFSHGGNVNYFLTEASVLGTISGTNGTGVKIANFGNIIGRINQDRNAGVAGIIDKFPNVVPITVNVKSNSLEKYETFNASIAYNENLLPKLGASVAYASLSKVADSMADSTVAINFDIKTNVTESGSISRKNMFYNDSDVGQVAVLELLQALSLVCSNVTAESDIFNIEVNVEIENERKTASLVSATPKKEKYRPGETVKLSVTLQPYRKPAETIEIPYILPLTAREGKFNLDIRGGALVSLTQNTVPSNVVLPSTEPPDKEYEKKIKSFLNLGRNNQIVIVPSATPPPKTEKERKAELKNAKKVQERILKSGKKQSAPQMQRFDSDYIIDNLIQVSVNVAQ